jgi:hypothetical protein
MITMIKPPTSAFIDRLFEVPSNLTTPTVQLTRQAELVKKCVANYSEFSCWHRACEIFKSLFGCSDWQQAKEVLFTSLAGRNHAFYDQVIYDKLKPIPNTILNYLIEMNAQENPISVDAARLGLQNKITASNVPAFHLGAYGFNHHCELHHCELRDWT